MNKEFKVIISVILTIWLFAMGMIIGQYSHRNSKVDVQPGSESVTASTSVAYVTNEQGAVYVDESGQPITQVVLPTPSEGTVFVTDSNGAVYVDVNGQPITSSVAQTTGSPVSDTQPVQPEQPTSGAQVSESATQKKDELIDARFTADAMAIKGKHFYVEGSEFSTYDGLESPLKFATDGTNSEIFTDLEGTEIGMMILDGEMYIVFNDGYLKLSKTLMDMLDINMEDYNFDSSFITTLFDDNAEAKVKSVKDDGKKVTLTSYTCSRGNIKAYSDGDKLIRVEVWQEGLDSPSEIFYFNSVTAEIPSKMLSTTELKKRNIVSFFTDFMKATGQEIELDPNAMGELSGLE